MVPATIAAYLDDRYPACVHRVHPFAGTAAELAAAVEVTALRVAKVVAVRLGETVALAVVPATDRVNFRPLEECAGARAELADEAEIAARFSPCEPGATAPLALFGVPIFADHRLLQESTILVAAGTHEDAVVLQTSEWSWSEKVLPITNLGRRRVRRRWRVPVVVERARRA